MDRLAAGLERLLPPAPDRVADFASSVEKELAAVDPAALAPASAAGEVPDDLAFALWRGTSLARADLLSSLTVVGPDGSRAIYSSGLPLDADGRLDLSPTRWIALAPPTWLARRAGGEAFRRDGRGRDWLVQWLAVPLPGFPGGDASAPAAADFARRAARGELAGAGAGGRAVLYERGGRVARSPWTEGTPPLDGALAGAPPFRRYAATPDGPARVAARAGDGYVAAVYLPLATPMIALERAGSFLVGAWLPGLAVALLLAAALRPWRMAAREVALAWRSYSRRLVLVFSAFLLLPIAVASSWVAHAYARQLERQQDASALDALHSAQRILGEYVLSLEPGFGVGTAVDDRLLEWLSRVVRSEVHLYWGSELYASSKRDLFSAGLVPARLAGEIWQRIHLDGERIARRSRRSGGAPAIEIYAALEIPGLAPEATKLVLALPQAARQGELAEAVAGIRRRAFLAAAALALLLAVSGTVLARRFARPIEEIVRGTQRIADGAPSLGYVPDEVELEALATAIDQMAARVAEARERLLAEKRLVERIAENVTAAVVGLDGAGRVVFANRLARDRVHAAPGEPLVERLRAAGAEALASALAGAPRRDEPVSARVDLGAGERDWTLVRVALPGPGEPSELVVIEDVTDVVRAQRLDAWAGMARIIAHEIKNPLTPIRLSAEHLREAWARDREHFAEVFERCTENILRQVEELRQTASEFSLYSEIPRIDRRPGDLREAIGEVVEAYRAAPPAGVTIEFDARAGAVTASFDRRLLGRAVRNLVENAVRASAAGGRVEVAVETRDGDVVVRVADDGPGVPPELVGRVVEPYFSTQSGGTGLGLPIARRIAEEHGGTLALRNRPSGGFEVTITIPRG
jgi:signal transduction histidine kinase/HAMP domain-containing protein